MPRNLTQSDLCAVNAKLRPTVWNPGDKMALSCFGLHLHIILAFCCHSGHRGAIEGCMGWTEMLTCVHVPYEKELRLSPKS